MSVSTRSVTVVAVSGLVVGGLLVAAPPPADAARACRVEVTTQLDATERFAGRGKLEYVFAAAQGSAVGNYDHQGNVIMTTFPRGAYPSLVHRKIGERESIGSMAQTQAPDAVGAINADFFLFADIGSTTDIEMARGPMVRDGVVIRGSYRDQRVVGLDTAGLPFGGELSLRGSVEAEGVALRVPVRSVNWHRILDGGASIYTDQWSSQRKGTALVYPRPTGVVEWVVGGRNRLKEIRSATQNPTLLGAPVKAGTRVIAFAADVATGMESVPLDTKVRARVRQRTTTGVTLTTAVGRGLTLIDSGRPAPLGCRAYGKSSGAKAARPRTIVGWDGKGRWRAFTVPGSDVSDADGALRRTGGFSLINAANIARQLGMRYAYELDGGGSTTLWTRQSSLWSRRDMYGVSNPSGCVCERPVANGLVFYKAP
jgi:hypothetical protein